MKRLFAEAALLSVLLTAEGLLFSRNLDTATNYDEGVYLASLDALERGETLGSEVFASQPPGFYLLLRVVGWLTPHSVHSARIGFLLVAVAGCAAAYFLGRALAGLEGGILAAGLLAIMPPFPSEAMRVDADVPSVTLALAALALAAFGFRRRAPLWLAGGAGAVFALAVSVKLLALAALVPLVGLALKASRRQLLALLGGAGVVTTAFLIAYAGVIGELWSGVVEFHDEARKFPSPVPNDEVLLDFLEFRTPSAWLVVLGVAATLLAWRQAWLLWAWTAASVVFLLVQRPLFEHHLVLLCAALAAPAGVAIGAAVRRLERERLMVAFGAVLLLLAAGHFQQGRRIDAAVLPEPAELRWGSEQLAACSRPGELVATDQPIAAFRARRPLPGQLVDASNVRMSTSELPPGKVLRIVDEARIRVVFAGRAFLDRPELLRALERRLGAPRRLGEARLYARGGCR